MKLQTYLLTEGRTQKITHNKFTSDVIDKCSDILINYRKNKRYIYRGIDSNDIFGYVKPSNFTRESAYAWKNYYTLLLDNLPSWKDYPKRSKSIITSTDDDYAEGFGGSLYVVFPVNNAKLAVAPSSDIWSSFNYFDNYGLFDLNDLNYLIYDTLEYNYSIIKNKNVDTWKKLENILKDERIKVRKKTTRKKYPYDKTLWDAIVPFMDPKKNGFKIISPKNTIPKGDHEMWTDADCYVLREDYLKGVLEGIFDDEDL